MAQEKIIGQFGMANGVVGPKEIINTIADMLRLSGVQNADRYFSPWTTPRPSRSCNRRSRPLSNSQT